MAQLYAKKTSDGNPKALECTDEGLLKVDTELTATIDPAGLATSAKQDTQIAAEQAILATGTKDNGPSWTQSCGVSGVPISADISGAATAVTDAPTTGQKIVIDDIVVGSSVAQVLTFTEETSGTVVCIRRIAAGQSVQFTLRGKRKLATANKKLMCQSSAAAATDVEVLYHSEA
jgi:hypothetical protein